MKKTLQFISLFILVSPCFAQVQKVAISSDGIALNAYFYQAAGDEAKPTLIWCHGNPGRPENGESPFAIELNQRGINVVRFNYRGLWGTDGVYTPGNCAKDLQNVLAFVLKDENSTKFHIDTSRVIVGGYSHGSNITIVSAMYDTRIDQIICLGLADFSYLIRETFNPNNAGMRKFSQEVKDAIWGDANSGQGTFARDYDKYVFDILFNNYKYDFVAQAEKLKNKRMYFIVGLNDVTVPIEHHFFPLFRQLKKMEHQNFHYEITESDHSFRDLSSEKRAEMVASWIHGK